MCVCVCLLFYIDSLNKTYIQIEVFIYSFTREQWNKLAFLSLSVVLVHFIFSLHQDELFSSLCRRHSSSFCNTVEKGRERERRERLTQYGNMKLSLRRCILSREKTSLSLSFSCRLISCEQIFWNLQLELEVTTVSLIILIKQKHTHLRIRGQFDLIMLSTLSLLFEKEPAHYSPDIFNANIRTD